MRVLIVGIIVLALAVAGVSTYLIQSFGGEEKVAELQKEQQKPKIRVLIATKNLRTGDVLKADAVAWQMWVEEALNAQFISVTKEDDEAKKMQAYAGQTVRSPIQAGEPILASKLFKRDKSGLLAGVLDNGMRAVSLAVSPETSSAGLILPGDRVDVLLTHTKAQEALQKKSKPGPRDPNAPLVVLQQTTETIVRNVRAIAINQTTAPPPEGAPAVPTQTITLEVTPKQAELLITARAMGRLSLALRSLQDGEGDTGRRDFTTDVEVSPFLRNIDQILAQIAEDERKRRIEEERKNEEERKKKAAAAPATTWQPKEKETVKIFRGGKAGLSEVNTK